MNKASEDSAFVKGLTSSRNVNKQKVWFTLSKRKKWVSPITLFYDFGK